MAQSSKPGPPAQAGRVALITGASRGLGYTVAEFLARQRWTLILSARHEVPLLEAVKRLQATGASISAVPGDVSQDQHRRDLIAAVRRVGRLDLLSKTLANELREAGVGVVAVDPGDLRTQMHQDAFPGQDISDRPLPEVTLPFWAWLEGQDPLRVTGQRFEAQGTVWEVPA